MPDNDTRTILSISETERQALMHGILMYPRTQTNQQHNV